MASGGISIHCVDIAHGRVAVGLRVQLRRLDSPQTPGSQTPLAEGAVGANGLWEHPALLSDAVGPGGYEVRFAVGEFYRAQHTPLPSPAFLEEVPYRFHIADPMQHYHLPFKFSPWGFSLFRGGA